MLEKSQTSKAVEEFKYLIEDMAEKIKGTMVAVRDGTIMGCSRAVYPYGSKQVGKVIDEAVRAAEDVFANHILALPEGAGGDAWQEAFIQAVTEGIEEHKYRGDPYDGEKRAHDMMLSKVIEIIPGFVRSLET